MRYLKLGILVIALSVLTAGSLVAVSEQLHRTSTPAVTAGACGEDPAHCSGGCGGPEATGPCAAEKLIKEKGAAKAAAPRECARRDAGQGCDANTREECPAGSTEAKAAAGHSGEHTKAAKADKADGTAKAAKPKVAEHERAATKAKPEPVTAGKPLPRPEAH